MKSCELNRLLISKFPNLIEDYQDEVDWKEGDETGSHTVYGDVFTPYIVRCIKNEKEIELKAIFDYLELVLIKQDEYASEVITLSVLESIQYLLKERSKYKEMIGKETKKVYEKL